MLDDENQDQSNQKISFESLDILIGKWKDGTFSEIIDDWKWIFSYSKRYKGAIAFYTILGIFSTSMGLVVLCPDLADKIHQLWNGIRHNDLLLNRYQPL